MNAHPDDPAAHTPYIDRVLRDGGGFAPRYRLVQADASVRWVVTLGLSRLDHEGKIIRFRGISIDITDRKLAEQQLRASEKG